MIYFDNASSTRNKPLTLRLKLIRTIKYDLSNPGRSGHKYALKSMQKVFDARCAVAEMLNSKPNYVIFTPSCTQALNLAIRGSLRPKGHIIATCFEHNSVIRTLEYLKQNYDVDYTIVYPRDKHNITVSEIENVIRDNTYLVIVNQTSNVTGDTQDIHTIGKMCKKHNLKLLVDMAQSGGHETLDMEKDNVNMVALAGHKGFYALQCGALALRDIDIKPIIFGGTGTLSDDPNQPKDYPDGFEAGTLAVANIISLKNGIEYVQRHKEKINSRTYRITKYLIDNLKNIDNVEVYSTNYRSGVVTFNISNLDAGYVADILSNKYHICCRSGLHCAPLAHKNIGTEKIGAVRLSICSMNYLWQARIVVEKINRIAKENQK